MNSQIFCHIQKSVSFLKALQPSFKHSINNDISLKFNAYYLAIDALYRVIIESTTLIIYFQY